MCMVGNINKDTNLWNKNVCTRDVLVFILSNTEYQPLAEEDGVANRGRTWREEVGYPMKFLELLSWAYILKSDSLHVATLI